MTKMLSLPELASILSIFKMSTSGLADSSEVIEMIVEIQTVNLIGNISHVEPILNI